MNDPNGNFREIIELNDDEKVIEVVHGKAEDIDLPTQVDIIVRWVQYFLFVFVVNNSTRRRWVFSLVYFSVSP